MYYFFSLLLFLVASQTYAQDLYVKTFGNSTATPIIYLHGGPGYNSAYFEATTAEKLATEGFFVILYDRRGEGRSEKMTANFTFQETIADLYSLYQAYKIEKAILGILTQESQ
ncbi:MAG: alpha/beta fold hydrolase [Saprospiraceae bacterium]